MTKYEALKQKADNYKNRLALAAYHNNLENGVSRMVQSVQRNFVPYLSNRNGGCYGVIDDEFTEKRVSTRPRSLCEEAVEELLS